jgi:hypothetical protein
MARLERALLPDREGGERAIVAEMFAKELPE